MRMNRMYDYSRDDDDYDDYEEIQERKERIKELEEEANRDIESTGEILTNTFPIKKYDGEFDEIKLWELFQPVEEDSEKRIHSQLEAIRYALWFARNNNNTAKNFIVMVINNPDLSESEVVVEEAKNAFFLFISSFIRTEIEKQYRKHKVHFDTDTQFGEAVREAMQCCWEPIMAGLSSFNPEKGMITTFLRYYIMEGYHSYESKRNYKSSKQILSIDSQIVRAKKALEEKGLDPNPRLIELELKAMRESNPRSAKQRPIGYQQIIASDERTKGEAACFSADDGSNEAFYFHKQTAQTRFQTPEEAVDTEERNEKIINAIQSLDEISRYIFLSDVGYEISDGNIYEGEVKTIAQLAEELDLSENEIFKKKNKAIDHLRKVLSSKEDDLLKGKELEFYEDKEDNDLFDFVNSIITITEDDFKDFRE